MRALAYSHLRTVALESLMRFFTRAQVPMERWQAANALASMASLAELRTSVPSIEEYDKLFNGAPRRR